MIKLKYCGIKRPEDVEVINGLNVDYVGFVFLEGKRRYVSPDIALKLREMLKAKIKTVGVFVNESVEKVVEIYQRGIINIIQLHGQEDEEYIARVRSLCDASIFKAFRIDDEKDIEKANASTADMVLLDNGAGGTGNVFDWKLLDGMKRDYILAGGISVDNIGEVLKTIKPYGIDVSSGIETDGFKDADKMIEFERIVRND